MKIINYLSFCIIPIIIFIIILFGIIEKKRIFDIFIEGVKEGEKIAINIIPTLLGLFLAINILRASGIFEFLTSFLKNFFEKIGFPVEILPLILIKPISRKCINCSCDGYY